MDYILLLLQGLLLVGISFLAMFKKNYFPKYLEKKAENAAQIEDIEKITSKIEGIQLEHKKQFDEIQKNNEVFFDEIKQTRNRFNSKQFELYNELWSSLIDLKLSADDLWASANKTKLHDFSKKVYSANISIEKSALLIEQKHYENLLNIIKEFEGFKFGKVELIELRSLRRKTKNELEHIELYDYSIDDIIRENGRIKNNYDSLLSDLKIQFKAQIRGDDI